MDNSNHTAKIIQAARRGEIGSLTVDDICLLRSRMWIELGTQNCGELPKDIANPPGFLGTVYGWILETSHCRQPMFALSASLILLGTMMGRKVRSVLGQHTNIFAFNIGRSSSGKDYPRQAVLKLLSKAGGEDLWRSKVTSDSAIESALEVNPNLLITIDEAGHYFRAANARSNRNNPSNSIKPALLELWSSADKTWKGKQRARCNGKAQEVVVVENPHVCLYGSTQPEIFYDGISAEDIRDGWIPRILFFFTLHQSRAELKDEKSIPEEVLRPIRKWVELGKNEEQEEVTVPATDGAREKLKQYSEEVFLLTSSDDPTRSILYGKVIENTIRVATILAVGRRIDNPKSAVISNEDITYSYNLVKYLTMTMEDVLKANLAENTVERNYKKILNLIKASGKQGLSKSELTAKSRTMLTVTRDRILEDLLEANDIKKVALPKGGSRFFAV